ncbi:MAG: sigma-70 family RNA polymerase sigma factor [Chitinophagaceae bacterium]|nr:sigma-70 family RNA polymerase sigma factor [Chitinophagaceae bacterium]
MMTSTATDIQLLQALRAGDSGAVNTVYDLYYDQLTYFVIHIMHDREAAGDIAVETFISLIKTQPEFSTVEKLKSWLFTTAYHKSLNLIRQNRRRNAALKQLQTEEIQKPGEEAYDQALIRSEAIKIIYREIEKLPPQIRQVIKLSFVEGKSVKEIAGELGTAVQTVQNQKTRGLQLLKAALSDNSSIPAAVVWMGLQLLYSN